MVRMKALACSLVIGAMCGFALPGYTQAATQPLREVHLPVPASRGGFSLLPVLDDMRAKDHFAMRVAPDQSILVFDSDASGEWPLVRVRKWWTDKPASEVLSIPGWSGHLDYVYVDIQVTPDGRFAVAFAGAFWGSKSKRQPDTIITVVDLEQWQVVKGVHTAADGGGAVRDARVVGGSWIALDARPEGSEGGPATARYRIWTLSIPDLRSGPECDQTSYASVLAGCKEVFKVTGASSDEALDVLIQRGSDVEPRVMRLRDEEWLEGALERESHATRGEEQRLQDADRHGAEFFRWWGEYPYFDQVWQNPPFESSARLWYGLYPSQERGVYELARYDVGGQEQRAKVASHFACGDPAIGKSNAACGCRVIDVSEEAQKLLNYCRKQNGDYLGMVQMEWLSVFRSDDLTGIGFINLPKRGYTLQAIASGDGRAYVVTLGSGELLRVYPIPDK
jgi:hypothetical protein